MEKKVKKYAITGVYEGLSYSRLESILKIKNRNSINLIMDSLIKEKIVDKKTRIVEIYRGDDAINVHENTDFYTFLAGKIVFKRESNVYTLNKKYKSQCKQFYTPKNKNA